MPAWSNAFSSHCSRPSPAAWAWGFRSVARSSRPMAAGSGHHPALPMAPSSGSRCRLRPREPAIDGLEKSRPPTRRSSLGVGIAQRARRQLPGMDNDLGSGPLELFEIVALHTLKLDHQHPRLCPFAVGGILHLADDCAEAVGAQMLAELPLVEAADRLDCLTEHLQVGIGKGRDEVSERIHSAAGGLGLVALEKLLDAGKMKRRLGHVEVLDDHVVELRYHQG